MGPLWSAVCVGTFSLCAALFCSVLLRMPPALFLFLPFLPTQTWKPSKGESDFFERYLHCTLQRTMQLDIKWMAALEHILSSLFCSDRLFEYLSLHNSVQRAPSMLPFSLHRVRSVEICFSPELDVMADGREIAGSDLILTAVGLITRLWCQTFLVNVCLWSFVKLHFYFCIKEKSSKSSRCTNANFCTVPVSLQVCNLNCRKMNMSLSCSQQKRYMVVNFQLTDFWGM